MITRNIQELPPQPSRVVSLVPSLTESLFDLGLGEHVVGVTDYCIHPAAAVTALPRVGGTKNPDVAAILALRPDLVIANQEENSRPALEKIAAAGVPVWLTFPQSIVQTLAVLRDLAGLFRSDRAFQQIDLLERSLEWARAAAASLPLVRYFCPIWQDVSADGIPWWMTFNNQTYMADLLALLGGENAFASRERRYPLAADLGQAPAEDAPGRDTRYPRVTLDEILAAAPEVILLPSEPYAYSPADLDALRHTFADTPAAQTGRIHLVDGTLLTWHGTRLARALRELDHLFHP